MTVIELFIGRHQEGQRFLLSFSLFGFGVSLGQWEETGFYFVAFRCEWTRPWKWWDHSWGPKKWARSCVQCGSNWDADIPVCPNCGSAQKHVQEI